MTCQEIIDFLMRYLDGELADEERRILEEHLGECPPCVAYLETYRQTIQVSRCACAARENPCEEIPEALVKAIVAACRKKT
jgi:anti-sigma factor RsiW